MCIYGIFFEKGYTQQYLVAIPNWIFGVVVVLSDHAIAGVYTSYFDSCLQSFYPKHWDSLVQYMFFVLSSMNNI